MRARSGIPARARLDTVGRRRRRRAASTVRAAGLHFRPWRTVNCRSAAIGTVRPIGSVWPVGSIGPVRAIWSARPVGSVRTIRPIWSIGAPWPVRPIGAPWPVGSVVTVAPMVVAPGAVAVVIRIDACAERRDAKNERQRASKPDHDCSCFLAVGHPRDGSACSALRLHYASCE